jgi:hypothetical protein
MSTICYILPEGYRDRLEMLRIKFNFVDNKELLNILFTLLKSFQEHRERGRRIMLVNEKTGATKYLPLSLDKSDVVLSTSALKFELRDASEIPVLLLSFDLMETQDYIAFLVQIGERIVRGLEEGFVIGAMDEKNEKWTEIKIKGFDGITNLAREISG